jgi:lipoate-protein ligase A
VLWTSAQPVLVLGTARPIRKDLLIDAAREDGLEILRRRSGGGTVILGPRSPAVTLIDRLAGDIRDCYRRFCAVLREVLAELGVAAQFRRPADMACGGRKIAGLAQRRRRRAGLVTASVLVRPLAAESERYLALPVREDCPEYRRGRTHREFMTSLEQLGVALPAGAFREAFLRVLERRGAWAGRLSPCERELATAVASQLSSPDWVNRL